MTTYTTTYPNPDTDGTSCALVYAAYLRSAHHKVAEAAIGGSLDAETMFVLDIFDATRPRVVVTCSEADEIYLFDTHHLSQIGAFLDCARVVAIIDHHPGGNPEAFEHATIINEQVGAAATIVTERLRTAEHNFSPSQAGILYAAILSNTLGFTAPTTTKRDTDAAAWLATQTKVPDDLARRMFEARSAFGSRSTLEILASDCKVFALGGCDVVICQIEGVAIEQVVNRNNVVDALTTLSNERGTKIAFLSAVDIVEKRTTIIPANEDSRQLLADALQLTFDHGRVTVDRILLRKSDLVPALKALLETKR